MTPTVRSGDVLRLNEPDYLYGTGVLVLRVSKVGAVQRLRDGQGLDLEGFTLRADGTQVNTAPRQVLVRLSALRSARRQPEGNR